MANDYRDKERGGRDRSSGGGYRRPEETPSRGMFGYEGEGYMRGGGRDYDDFARRGYGRDTWSDESNSRGYGPDRGNGGPSAGVGRGHLGATGYRDIEQGWSEREREPRPSFRGRGPKNYQRSDDRILEDVCERLAMDHDVDASEIEVNVSGGTVTLTGSVTDRNAKRRAEDLAEAVAGVKDVQNQIRVAREERAG